MWKKVWLCGDKGEIRSPLHPSCCPNKAPANEEAIPCRPHGPAAAKVSQIRPLQRESDRQQYNQDNGFDRRWSLRERAPTMFNVIISGEENVWETDQLMRMDVTRFKEYSGGPEADKISIAKPNTWKLLEKAPTLLLYEANNAGLNADVVRYGFVHQIRVNSKYVFFCFRQEGRISTGVLNDFATRLGLSQFELNRTHWAVKEGGIPSGLKDKAVPYYDVVFSFAGEDRGYVEKVARYLHSRGVKLFYDRFEVTHLWGRDLAEHFDMVYATSARYCVIFISKSYVNKMWTRLERRTALERALKEHGEYILPARFDNTPVDGIRSTLAYISLSELKPSEFARHILSKLGLDVK